MRSLAVFLVALCAPGLVPAEAVAQGAGPAHAPPALAQEAKLTAASASLAQQNGITRPLGLPTAAPGTARGFDFSSQAQEEAEQEEAPSGLLVFLDCQGRTCDQDYLRREITFVNYVRDRQDAQIHVLVTSQFAGGGQEFTFDFIGLREFEGDDIRLVWMSSNTNTEDERREGIAQMIRAGVVHYLAKTPLIHQLDIREQVQQVEQRFLVVDPDDDPWNFWVFRINVNGQVGGEDRRSNYNIRLMGSANRTTEDWKIRFNANFRHDERKFILNDGTESIGTTRSYSFTHQTVKSLGEHWGLSVKGAAWQASFTNHELVIVGAPGIEYNVFPYGESSRRIFTFTYEIGVGHDRYFEETIFEKTAETLLDHALLVNMDAVQPWGEFEAGVELVQFLNHWDQWSAQLNGRIDFRITRGLSFNVRGNWAAVRNQRFLAVEEQTNEEILLRQAALATNSTYQINYGITYQFGSIFNNIVNPRFTSNRDGFGGFGGGGPGGGPGGGGF
ncbi:MAG TPA: hypothetical protein VGD06_11015 [Acidobacteriota bacterium]